MAKTKAGRECYHCKRWIEDFSTHDCWTTTPEALTRDLSEDLRDAWERLRETALDLGEQRMYASHSSIMFSRKACYFFVRPRPKYLELCVFLGRALVAPHVKKAAPSSSIKFYNLIRITHRDEVEAPITEWLAEAYRTSDALSGRQIPTPKAHTPKPKAKSSPPKATNRKTAATRRVSSPKASATSRRRPARRAARGGR
jgi:hypothetical protein